MLIEFRVKNFRSIKEEQLLTMVASADKELPDNVAVSADKKHRLIKSAAIYGKNASGKTNIVKALRFVERFVENSTDNKPQDKIDVVPFHLDPSTEKQPSEFEIDFLHEGIRYQYGFIVDQHHIHSEWLYAYPKGSEQTWFVRTAKDDDVTQSKWEFGRNLKGQKQVIADLTSHNTLFLSRAAQMNNQQLQQVQKWFVRLGIMDNEASKNLLEFVTSVLISSSILREQTINLIHQSDTGIVNIKVPDTSLDIPKILDISLLSDESNDFQSQISSVRDSIDFQHRDSEDNIVSFKIDDESSGTRRLFGLGSMLILKVKAGGVVVVDELDSSLHPLLARQLLQLFHDPALNETNAQLIFNTHDSTLLDLSLFRRDQIWFTEKDRAGETHLYSLLDFSPRKNESISKGYLQGRYGAIPYLDMDAWRGVFDEQEA